MAQIKKKARASTRIAFANTKGGVGKTVSCVHLGAQLAARGCRVLLVDIDLQHGLSNYFSLEARNGGTRALLLGDATIEDVTDNVRENLDVIAADATLESAEIELAARGGAELRLRRAFKDSTSYDFVLFDCPSGFGTVTRNAMLASQWFVLPVNSEPAALATARDTAAAAAELGEYHDGAPQLLGVLLTRFRATRVASAVAASCEKEWGDKLFEARIRQTEKVNELSLRRMIAGEGGAASSGVADDHAQLASEVMARCAKAGAKA